MVLLIWAIDYRSFSSIFSNDTFQKYHSVAYFSTEFTSSLWWSSFLTLLTPIKPISRQFCKKYIHRVAWSLHLVTSTSLDCWRNTLTSAFRAFN
jgi:hypothetical protein